MIKNPFAAAVLLLSLATPPALARQWTDASGRHTFEADLIAYNDSMVVLQTKNRELLSVATEQLSKEDQDFLKSKEASDQAKSSTQADHTWTLTNGLKVNGRVVRYGRRDVSVQRRRGKVYVNDRLYDNLPPIYQRMVPRIVGYFEGQTIENGRELEAWATKLRGQPKTFTCEGVMLELENGDEYGVPFFFFSEDDLRILQPGWEAWAAADQNEQQRQQEEFLVQTQADAYQHDHAMNQQIKRLELGLLAVNAGVTSLWEVVLSPPVGVPGRLVSAVVPARDSLQAQSAAAAQYPGYVPGPTRRLN